MEVRDVRLHKWNPLTNALEYDVMPFDVKPLTTGRKTSTSAGDLSLGTYSVPSGKYAIITGIKFMAESQNTWFSIGGDASDLHYLPAKGTDVLAGTANDFKSD